MFLNVAPMAKGPTSGRLVYCVDAKYGQMAFTNVYFLRISQIRSS